MIAGDTIVLFDCRAHESEIYRRNLMAVSNPDQVSVWQYIYNDLFSTHTIQTMCQLHRHFSATVTIRHRPTITFSTTIQHAAVAELQRRRR